MKATRTWILVADGARARILEQVGPGGDLHPLEGAKFSTASKPSRELGTDRPGRVRESVGHQRHAIEPRYDPHRGLETLFAHQLADILSIRLREGLFDRLIIVAPPVMLGDLRSALAKPLQEALIGEIAKDLTKTPNGEILEHVRGMTRH